MPVEQTVSLGYRTTVSIPEDYKGGSTPPDIRINKPNMEEIRSHFQHMGEGPEPAREQSDRERARVRNGNLRVDLNELALRNFVRDNQKQYASVASSQETPQQEPEADALASDLATADDTIRHLELALEVMRAHRALVLEAVVRKQKQAGAKEILQESINLLSKWIPEP